MSPREETERLNEIKFVRKEEVYVAIATKAHEYANRDTLFFINLVVIRNFLLQSL